MAAIEPERPHEVGVVPKTADVTREEGSRVLADEACDVLGPHGFSHQQVREWAETYIADHGSGDVNEFVKWIWRRQRQG